MYCVIVGDIIHSKSLDFEKRNESTDTINRVLDYINSKYENDILASFGIVRGDAFEGVLFSQQAAPKIIQDIIIGLYEDDVRVRISAAIGELSVVSPERNKADGPAFYSALNRIEELRKTDSDHWFQVSMLTNSIGQPLVDGLLHMITALTMSWTQKQTNIVWNMIRYENRQTLVSDKLGIAPSSVSRQLKAARYEAYQAAWTGLEQYLLELEERSVTTPQTVTPTYTTYYSLATRKAEMEDYSAAIAFYREGLECALKEFGKDSPHLVRIYNGLINAYLELIESTLFTLDDREEYLKLIHSYIDTCFSCQRTLPKNRIEYARTVALYGDYLSMTGEYDQAIQQYAQAIQIMEYCDSAEPRWLFECYNNMALLYAKNGNDDAALAANQTALIYAEQNRDISPITYAVALHNLGMQYASLDREEDAIQTLNKALEIYLSILPAKDRRIAIVKSALEEIMSA